MVKLDVQEPQATLDLQVNVAIPDPPEKEDLWVFQVYKAQEEYLDDWVQEERKESEG